MSSKNVDRLSSFPEEIVSHILSQMPTKSAIQTSILSKRWRYSWMSVTNLDFGDIHTIPSLESLTKIVDRVLMFCQPSQLKLFRLHFPVICAQTSNVLVWIDKAVKLNVRELDLRVHLPQLPFSMFTCKTLTKLRLEPSGYDLRNVWEFQCPVNLPCLKTLDITVFANPFVNAFKLIRGCPMLESLSLDVFYRTDEEDYIFNIPTLKRLKLTWFKGTPNNKVVLNLPNLEYLFVGREFCCSVFIMEDVSSLVEVSVLFCNIRFDHMRFELLKGISGVKSLSARIGSPGDDFNIPFTSPLPIFPNMKHLELKGFWHCGAISQYLESCPELKHLCIENVIRYSCKPDESSWVEPKLVPACMLTNLTTVKFSTFKMWDCDIELLKYMLGNSEVLKTVTIICKNSSIEEEKRLYAKVVKLLPRASRRCEIRFHGRRSHSTIIL